MCQVRILSLILGERGQRMLPAFLAGISSMLLGRLLELTAGHRSLPSGSCCRMVHCTTAYTASRGTA